MKNKFVITTLLISSFVSFEAFSQSTTGEQKKGENFANHKAEMVTNLTREKGIIEQAISCINAAQNHDGSEKCHEQLKASKQHLDQQKLTQKKSRLQEELNKLNEKQNKMNGQSGTSSNTKPQ